MPETNSTEECIYVKLLSKFPRSNDPPSDTTLAQVMTSKHATIICERQQDLNLGGVSRRCPDPTSLNLTKRKHNLPATDPRVAIQTQATYRIAVRVHYQAFCPFYTLFVFNILFLKLMVQGRVDNLITSVFVKVNFWTLGQAYKVHGKEVKNENPKIPQKQANFDQTFYGYRFEKKKTPLEYY